MKVKNRSVCQNCRTRKLGCDGKHPECSQCLLTGRQCPGYPVNWSFVEQTRPKPAQKKRSQRESLDQDHHCQKVSLTAFENPPSGPSNQTYSHRPTAASNSRRAELVDLIIRSYAPEEELNPSSNISNEPLPRICGSWVEVLPELSEQADNGVLLGALDALATSITSQTSPGGTPSVDSARSYSTAIQMMQKELSSANKSSDRELLASIMCLSLAELMFAGSAEGITVHANAVAQIIQSHGPERYQRGILHKLFIGFRPLLMMKAVQDRKPSFLGSEDWKTFPFAILSPSPMQSLLSETAMLPSLLWRMDEISDPSTITDDEYDAIQLFIGFGDMLYTLNEWEKSASNNDTQPLYWYQDQDKRYSEMPAMKVPCIWFPSVTMANALTYIWTCRIICLHEMERLSSSLPQLSLEYSRVLRKLRIESFLGTAPTLMTQICQSMEYLLQDQLKLFGPASTVLPLQVAYAVAQMDSNQHRAELTLIRRVLDRLVRKGLQSFPSLMFEKNPFVNRWDVLSNTCLERGKSH